MHSVFQRPTFNTDHHLLERPERTVVARLCPDLDFQHDLEVLNNTIKLIQTETIGIPQRAGTPCTSRGCTREHQRSPPTDRRCTHNP